MREGALRLPASTVASDKTDGTLRMTSLRRAWDAVRGRLVLLEPLDIDDSGWMVLERLHRDFADRAAHVSLPIALARVTENARRAIMAIARRFDDVETVSDAPDCLAPAASRADPMAAYAARFQHDVDAIMGVLVPTARFRKGHYAYGRFTVPAPHGLHTDHSAEDPLSGAEPICITRIEALGTHYVAGDVASFDAGTRRMLDALRYWTAVPEGDPDAVLDILLARGVMRTMPVDHLMLMVAGNANGGALVTPHMAARPPEGGLHSAFFQRQYQISGAG